MTSIRHGDEGYDNNAMRRKIKKRDTAPNAPPNIYRHWKIYLPFLYYWERTSIDRIFEPIKDFRRTTTRYDQLGQNFFSPHI